MMQKTEKLVYKTLLVFAPVILIIIFLFELIFKNYTFIYSLSFLIGTMTSALCFFISIKAVDAIDPYSKRRTKTKIIGAYFIKLIIYACVALFCYLLIYKHTIFTCFLGFLSIRISIHLRYIVIEPYLDKHRKIELLNVSDNIKEKLKEHQIFKFNDLTNTHKDALLTFLTNLEYKKLHSALKEYELFVKGELEVIKEDENSNDGTESK